MEEQKSRLNIQWFPGHMTKAKRQMEEHLKMVDMVIELRDARIPDASKNPLIDELTAHKPRLILLSKKDKAEAEVTAQWVSALEKEEVRVLAVDLLHEKLEKKITAASQELMQAKIERMRRRGMRPRAIRAMVAGVPNVGKSTLINSLAHRVVVFDEDHIHTRLHDLAHRHVGQIEDVVDHALLVFEKLDILGHHVLDLVLGNAFAFRAQKIEEGRLRICSVVCFTHGRYFTIFSGITGCRRASASRARPWRRHGRRR